MDRKRQKERSQNKVVPEKTTLSRHHPRFKPTHSGPSTQHKSAFSLCVAPSGPCAWVEWLASVWWLRQGTGNHWPLSLPSFAPVEGGLVSACVHPAG